MLRFAVPLLVSTLLILTLSGCGQKGDLYLPSETAGPGVITQPLQPEDSSHRS